MVETRFREGDSTVVRARELRRNSKPAEQKLWLNLRGGALDGLKFRRQQRLGPFFGDFVCQSARFVVEIDGETHVGAEVEARDERRTAFLQREGYRVIRFFNADVMKNLEGVLTSIRQALALSDSPSPSHAAAPREPLPLPQGERS